MATFQDPISGEIRELNFNGIKCKMGSEVPMVNYFMPDTHPAMSMVQRTPPPARASAWRIPLDNATHGFDIKNHDLVSLDMSSTPGGVLLVPRNTDYVAARFNGRWYQVVGAEA